MKLSIMSEAFMAKVDAVLKRRIHANKSKYSELEWQKEEVNRKDGDLYRFLYLLVLCAA